MKQRAARSVATAVGVVLLSIPAACGPGAHSQSTNNAAAMQQAAADARARWGEFMGHRERPRSLWGYQVRYAFPVQVGPGEPPRTELLWVSARDIDEAAGAITGPMMDEPKQAIGVQWSQDVTVPIADIADWLVLDENGTVAAGGFTLDVEGAEGYGRDWYGLQP